jgi:hypothetical protein
MEWYVAQTIALIVIIAVHGVISAAVMVHRRRQLSSKDRGLPSGVSGVSFHDRSAHGAPAHAGDTYFRNYFSKDEEQTLQLPEKMYDREMEKI